DLSSVLQQLSRYAGLVRKYRIEQKYVDLLGERVELASKTAQSLFDRVTSKIQVGAAKKSEAARKSEAGFTVMPPPSQENARSMRGSRKGEQKRAASTSTQAASEPGGNGVPPGVRTKNPHGSREYLLLIEDEPDVADLASE